MNPPFQQQQAGGPSGLPTPSAAPTTPAGPDRFDELKMLSASDRQRMLANTERLRNVVETFGEGMSAQVVVPIAQLADQHTIALREVINCQRSTWDAYRQLFSNFRREMRFFCETEPDPFSKYFNDVSRQVDDCMERLADLTLLEETTWAEELGDIAHKLRSALSLDVTYFSGPIRDDLQILRRLSADNPEAP
jgi:hypothetical protein